MRLGTSLASTGLLLSVLLVPPTAATQAGDAPDVTAPQVPLDPCPEVPSGEACSRRSVAAVAQVQVDPTEGLAVAGVRSGERVLVERVYDDGSGFTPYGPWVPPYSDLGNDYDYVTAAVLVSPDLHELTFYARDLAGNEATFTRTVRGPSVPSAPEVRGPKPWSDGHTKIAWTWDDHGSPLVRTVLRVRGQEPIRTSGPGNSSSRVRLHYLLDLPPGRHVARAFAVNRIGKGPTGRVVFRVPLR